MAETPCLNLISGLENGRGRKRERERERKDVSAKEWKKERKKSSDGGVINIESISARISNRGIILCCF